MNIKIKYQPEDFVVEEIATLPLQKKGTYAVYQLTKRSVNTVDVIRQIAKMAQIPFGSVAYGGKKDRHALATQFITVRGQKIADLQEKDFSLKFVGFIDRPMGPDLIEGNRFEIVVRKLTEAQATQALEEANIVKEQGFINYFDDQRFGGYDELQGFLVERILKKQFNGAVKTYLTSIYSGDKTAEKKRLQFFVDHWKDWKSCQGMAVTGFEKLAFDHLAAHPTDFLPVLEQIPKEDLSMAFSAYQSFLWNELVRRLLKEKTISLSSVPGIAGEYLFPKSLSAEVGDELRQSKAPTISAKVHKPYESILQERELKAAMFNKMKLRQVFFKSIDRNLVVVPQELKMEIADDEFYPKYKKISLKFILPRGSYATMFLKRLFIE